MSQDARVAHPPAPHQPTLVAAIRSANRAAHASSAVGGGVLAIDLVETGDGFSVIEVNYTMGFRNSIAPTGVDIPARIIDYTLAVGEGREPAVATPVTGHTPRETR